MQDPVTLDQLRTFVVVVEEGSFSAAGRKLRRVQSAVSTAMGNLEQQLGVQVWDRSTKTPKLTDHGRAVLAAAGRILTEVDALKSTAIGLAGGLEASVSLCVDALYPVRALVDVCAEFAKEFPRVDLRVDTQTMSAVSELVSSGKASLGVVSPLGLRASLERRALAPIRMVPVTSARHALASVKGRISAAVLSEHVQIVLSERPDVIEEGVADQAVLSARTWRVADLHTKHAMLLAGLGWGNLPEHVADADLRAGRLVVLRPEAWAEDEHTLVLSAVYRKDRPLGPAHRWLVEALQRLCERESRTPVISASRTGVPKGRKGRRSGGRK